MKRQRNSPLGESHAPPVNGISSPWKSIQTKQEERDQKKEAILRIAASLFLQQGYDRASLNDVAASLNISKPTLYVYFASKDEILLEVYRHGFQIAKSAIDEALKKKQTGLERVRTFIRRYSSIMTQDLGMCLVRINFRVLSSEHQSFVARERGKIDRALRSLIEEGIADGSIQPCDAKFKSLAMFGAMHWIGEWYRPDGALSADEVGEKLVEALTVGLGAASRQKRMTQFDKR